MVLQHTVTASLAIGLGYVLGAMTHRPAPQVVVPTFSQPALPKWDVPPTKTIAAHVRKTLRQEKRSIVFQVPEGVVPGKHVSVFCKRAGPGQPLNIDGNLWPWTENRYGFTFPKDVPDGEQVDILLAGRHPEGPLAENPGSRPIEEWITVEVR